MPRNPKDPPQDHREFVWYPLTHQDAHGVHAQSHYGYDDDRDDEDDAERCDEVSGRDRRIPKPDERSTHIEAKMVAVSAPAPLYRLVKRKR